MTDIQSASSVSWIKSHFLLGGSAQLHRQLPRQPSLGSARLSLLRDSLARARLRQPTVLVPFLDRLYLSNATNATYAHASEAR